MQISDDKIKNIFKTSVEFFLKKFSIDSYEVSYEFTKSSSKDYRAQLATNNVGRMAHFSLNISNAKDTDDIMSSAFHEVIELLIINLYGGIKADEGNILFIVSSIDQSERHIVVRTLENVVYPLFKTELIGILN